MTAITFDTLKLAQRLRDKAKYTPEQAESTASVLSETLSEWNELQELATKADVSTLKAGIDTLKTELKPDIREFELRLKLQIGTMIFALGGVLIAVRFFGHG